MTWTRETPAPNPSGWYWWRRDGGCPQVVYVTDHGLRVRLMGLTGPVSFKELEGQGEWYGPLVVPDGEG
jgi:hypothetical protein